MMRSMGRGGVHEVKVEIWWTGREMRVAASLIKAGARVSDEDLKGDEGMQVAYGG